MTPDSSASWASISPWSLRQLIVSVARGAGRAGGREVGVDVGAAERVDRLLGVGDQHQRRAGLGERAAHDLPLDRIGVLELVDQHDLVARAQLRGGGGRPGPASVALSRVSRSS